MLSREEAGAGAAALISAFGLTAFGFETFLGEPASMGVSTRFFVPVFGLDFLTVFLTVFFAVFFAAFLPAFFAAFFTFLAGVFFAFFTAAFLARFFDAAV